MEVGCAVAAHGGESHLATPRVVGLTQMGVTHAEFFRSDCMVEGSHFGLILRFFAPAPDVQQRPTPEHKNEYPRKPKLGRRPNPCMNDVVRIVSHRTSGMVTRTN